MNAAVEALLHAAGYPAPPTMERTVLMLLGELEASKGIADRAYRGGYNLGYQHGRNRGRIDAACELCTYPPEGASS